LLSSKIVLRFDERTGSTSLTAVALYPKEFKTRFDSRFSGLAMPGDASAQRWKMTRTIILPPLDSTGTNQPSNMLRSALYEKVWSTPISHLAKQFGVSDTALAKICRKNRIPLPVRGHWAKLAAGKQSPQVALPDPEPDFAIEFSVETGTGRTPLKKPTSIRRSSTVPSADDPKTLVEPTDKPQKLHPLVARTLSEFSSLAKKSDAWEKRRDRATGPFYERQPGTDKGRCSADFRTCLSVTVALENVDGAIDFLQALVTSLEKTGFKIEVGAPKPGGGGLRTLAKKDGEVIAFSLVEGYHRREASPSEMKDPRRVSLYSDRYTYFASGKFTLSANGDVWGAHKKWAGSIERLVDSLQPIVAAFDEMVPLQKKLRQERAESEARHREEERRAYLNRRRAEAQHAELKAALEDADSFERFTRLEPYLSALEAEFLRRYGSLDKKTETWLWLVRQLAGKLSPIERRITALKERSPWAPETPDWWPADAGPEADDR
jgi:hypothetical protein